MLHGNGSEDVGRRGAGAGVMPGWAVPIVGTAAAAVEPAAPAVAVNVKVPSIGWESELTTRHTTVYGPAGAPGLSFCEATLSTISTAPSAQLAPAASLTSICEPSASGLLVESDRHLLRRRRHGGAGGRAGGLGGVVRRGRTSGAQQGGGEDCGAQQGTQKLSDEAHGQATPSVGFLTD